MADDIKIVIGVDSAPVDRAVRVMDNLEAEARDVERAFKKGLITEKQYNAETVRLTKSMDRLKTVAKGSAKDFRTFEKTVYGSGKAMRQKEIAMQQAGYQLQDFIVQIQAGTNPLIAFSQQGSQLAGFFAGPWGAAIGLGIAALGGLGTALLGTKGKTDDLATSLDKASDAISGWKDAIDSANEPTKSLEDRFGGLSDYVYRARQQVAEFRKEIAQMRFDNALDKLMSDYVSQRGAGARGTRIAKQFDLGREYMVSLKKETRAAVRREANTIVSQLNFLQTGEGRDDPENQASALDKIINSMNILAMMKDGMSESEAEIIEHFMDQRDLIFQMNELTNDQITKTKERGDLLTQIQTDAMAMEAEAAEEIKKENKDRYDALIRLQDGHYAIQKREDEAYKQRMQLYYKTAGSLMQQGEQEARAEQKETSDQLYHNTLLAKQNAMALDITQEKDRQKLADQTHAHMMALQKAYYDDAKTKAAETASATYLANYNAVLAYQQYGETRTAAPTKPVEPPKKTKTRDPLADLKKQLDLEQALIGKTEARQRVIQSLGTDFMKYGKDTIDSLEKQINKTIQLEEAERKRQETIDAAIRQQEELKATIEDSMGDAFMSIIDGTKSVEDAFRDMARQIIAHLMRVYVVQTMVNSFTGGLPLFNANGNAFSNGNVVPYANGGVVGGPTYFPMAGGKTGLMGEAGPEAIMPLKRGKGGKLGVEASGQGSNIVINQSFNFAANGDDSVKRIIASEAPKIAKMTEAQILDNSRRGGQFRKAFA